MIKTLLLAIFCTNILTNQSFAHQAPSGMIEKAKAFATLKNFLRIINKSEHKKALTKLLMEVPENQKGAKTAIKESETKHITYVKSLNPVEFEDETKLIGFDFKNKTLYVKSRSTGRVVATISEKALESK